LLGELPAAATVTPAIRPLVSMMQKTFPCVALTELTKIVPVVQAEYVGVVPLGRLTILS
jgi:hypothetical protein